MTPFAERLVAAMQPWMTPDLERYLEAIAVMFDQVAALVDEVGTDGEPGYVPPWGRLLDPDLCPYAALGWLAQFVGVPLPITATEAEARKLVKEEQGFARGTTASIETAIYRNTTITNTGIPLTDRGILLERTAASGIEDAYHFCVVCKESQVPSKAALEAAVNEKKPGGVMWTLIYSEGLVWTAAPGAWSEATHTWATANEAP